MRARLLALFLLSACSGEEPKPDDTDADTDTDTDTDAGTDADGDGYDSATDCDDADASVTGAPTWYRDFDDDGYAEGTEVTLVQCEPPTGYTDALGDCDIYDDAISPDATEICDDADVDEDCDGLSDDADASVDPTTWTSFHADDDGDGWGAGGDVTACDAPGGFVDNGDDCDDADAGVSPGATEVCDGATDEDCDGLVDDADASPAGTSAWYADADADGYGDPGTTVSACAQPPGHVADATDCDDGSADVSPGGAEVCDAANADEDCDGAADDADGDASGRVPWYVDADGDGAGSDTSSEVRCDAPGGYAATDDDCDDGDAAIHPGATEVCDAADVDEDCDGSADDADTSVSGRATWYADTDGDTYGSPSSTRAACEQPGGYVADATDCDDGSASTSPAGVEVCDAANADEDCDGAADDADAAAAGGTTWYADTDGDGYGTATATRTACDAPSGYAATATDCDDSSASIRPSGTEVCDADDADEDCDGLADDADSSATGKSTFYVDADGDGYGTSSATTSACDAPSGYAAASGDCDDGSASENPGAAEVCDAANVDEDCDGLADDSDPGVTSTTRWYRDLDGDGYGGSTTTRDRCDQPAGYVAAGTDCDDTTTSVGPGMSEVCDAADVDEDCDGLSDDADGSATGQTAWHPDADGDGYGSDELSTALCEQPAGSLADGTDCDDGAAGTYPGAAETCDDVDQDCDGAADDGLTLYFPDYDGDGYGDAVEEGVCTPFSPSATVGGDCDELDDAVNPGADETCNGLDDDCDEYVDDSDASLDEPVWYTDADGDGYGVTSAAQVACTAPSGTAEEPGDCDDTDLYTNPGMDEIYGDATDDDCDGETEPVGTYCTPNVPSTYATIHAALAASGSACLDEGTYTEDVGQDGIIAGQGRGRTTLVGDIEPGYTGSTNTLTIESLTVIGYIDGTYVDEMYLSDCGLVATGAYGLYVNDPSLVFSMDACEVSGGTGAGIHVSSTTTSGRGSYTASYSITNSWFHDNNRAVWLTGTFRSSTGAVTSGTIGAAVYNNTFTDNVESVRTTNSSNSTINLSFYNNVYDSSYSFDTSTNDTRGDNVSSTSGLDFSYEPPRPSAGSSLIDQGTAVTTTDYWGVTRSGDRDIGAVEY